MFGKTKALQQEQTILEYSKEIFNLRAELSEKSAQYNNLYEQITFLKSESKEYENVISELKVFRDSLTVQLTVADTTINNLRIELDSANLREERLKAETNSLKETINRILGKSQMMAFGEVLIVIPNSVGATFSVGSLIRGKSVYLGLNIGYLQVTRRDDFEGPTDDVILSLIPVTLQTRFAVGKYQLGFRYVDPDIPLFERKTFFVSLEAGYGIDVESAKDSDFNRGGSRFSIGGGIMVAPSETINAYVVLGLDFQRVKRVTSNQGPAENLRTLTGLRLGIGLNL